jgi:hypothetical protein
MYHHSPEVRYWLHAGNVAHQPKICFLQEALNAPERRSSSAVGWLDFGFGGGVAITL